MMLIVLFRHPMLQNLWGQILADGCCMIPKDKEIGSEVWSAIVVAARLQKLQRRKSFKGDIADCVYHAITHVVDFSYYHAIIHVSIMLYGVMLYHCLIVRYVYLFVLIYHVYKGPSYAIPIRCHVVSLFDYSICLLVWTRLSRLQGDQVRDCVNLIFLQ